MVIAVDAVLLSCCKLLFSNLCLPTQCLPLQSDSVCAFDSLAARSNIHTACIAYIRPHKSRHKKKKKNHNYSNTTTTNNTIIGSTGNSSSSSSSSSSSNNKSSSNSSVRLSEDVGCLSAEPGLSNKQININSRTTAVQQQFVSSSTVVQQQSKSKSKTVQQQLNSSNINSSINANNNDSN